MRRPKARSNGRARTCWRWTPAERAAKGVFLSFQYPIEIPGVPALTFVRTALNAQKRARGEEEVAAPAFLKLVREASKALKMDFDMLKRPLNVGFSGGEKKRMEILQMALLEPSLLILDETDSGLDIDALRIVSEGSERSAFARPRHAGHHPLSAPAGLYQTGPGACAGRRPHRRLGRTGTGVAAGGGRI